MMPATYSRRSTWTAMSVFAIAWLIVSPALLAQNQNPSASILRAYSLRHVAAAAVKPEVEKALAELPERPKVVVDERANRLLVRGSERAHQLAEHVIAGLDRAAGAAPGPDRPAAPAELAQPIAQRRHTLRHAAWRDVHATLQRLWRRPIPITSQPGGPRVFTLTSSDGPKVELLVDSRGQSIMLRGPGNLVDAWTRVIEAVDRPPANQADQTQLVQLQRSDPEVVRRAVSAIQTGNTARVRQHLASVGSRPALRLLAMLAQAQVKDNAAAQNGNQPPPGNGQPDAAQPDAAQQDKGQPEADPDAVAGGVGGLIGPVQIEYIEGLDVYIIRGRPRDVEQVVKIIQEIESLTEDTQPVVRVLPLRHVDSEAMQTLVTGLYGQGQLLSARQGQVSITALVKPNALLLIGRQESVDAVVNLVRRLDRPVPPSTQFHVFRLKYAAALDTMATIQQFYGDRVAAPELVRPVLGTKIYVTADVRSNSLIVRASPRDIAELAELLKSIDTATTDAANELRVFRLQYSLAEELAPVLEGAIRGQLGTTPGGGGGGAIPTPGGPTGPGQQAAQALTGQRAGARAPSGVKSTSLQFLTVDSEGRRLVTSGILSDVRITADPRGNTLIVSAPAESMELIAALIERLDQMPTAEAQIKVFTIKNGDSAALALMLEDLFAQQAGQGQGILPTIAAGGGEGTLVRLRFSVDQRTNSIIASGSAADLNVVEAILLRLDDSDIEERKSTVYRLKNSPAIDVANAINELLRSERQVQQINPQLVSPFDQIEREVVVVPEPVSNSLIVSATPRYYEAIRVLVEELDQRPPMVMVQVLIAEVALSDIDEVGIEIGLQDEVLFDRSLLGDLITTTNSTQTSDINGVVTQTEEIIQSATNTPGFNFNNQPPGNSGSDSALSNAGHIAAQGLSHFATGRVNSELGFGGLVLSASSEAVSVLVRALQQTRRLEVLSRPQIMTLDNQPAFIQIGQRVPRITNTNITETGGQVNTTTLENVGILLGIRPRISPDGLVVMELDAEKSEVGPEAEGIPISISPTGEVIRSPRINTTTAQTTVSSLSGQTIVLGGLIFKSQSTTHRRVPLLADIPILGNAFRFDNVTNTRTELLIIMTPHIVRTEEDAEYLKQVESARMSWVLGDVMEIHGDVGLRGRGDHWADCEAETVYPDQQFGEVIVPPDPNRQHPPVLPAPQIRPRTPGQPLPQPSSGPFMNSRPNLLRQQSSLRAIPNTMTFGNDRPAGYQTGTAGDVVERADYRWTDARGRVSSYPVRLPPTR